VDTDRNSLMPGTADSFVWHAIDPGEVAARLGSGNDGLSESVAAERLGTYGPNQLEETPPTSPWTLLLRQFRSPLIYILLIAALVTFVLGEYIDTGVISAVLILNAVIGFTQERQAEISIRSLMRLVSPHARVIRDDREIDIESRDLVPGDLVLLESGVRVPADLRLVMVATLFTDESLLTGESETVLKQAEPIRPDAVLADRANMVYAGTVVASGRGRGYVVATGVATELGSIATEVRAEERPETPLQHRLHHFAQVIAYATGGASLLAFAIGIARGQPATEIFTTVVAMAVAAVPEALPVVATITLAVSVRRMAGRNAIVRRLPAVETLGSTTVIGSDKTGTLTENRMTVRSIWAGSRIHDLERDELDTPATVDGEDALSLTLLAGVLANEARISSGSEGYSATGDPTEVALLVSADRLGIDADDARSRYRLQAEIPFEPDRRFSGAICQSSGREIQFVKGAPERVLAMCDRLLTDHGPVPLDPDSIAEVSSEFASRGLRVLAMAYAPDLAPDLPLDDTLDPHGLVFLGLQGLLDPPREGVRDSIVACRAAGIRVVMITGDHAETARAIARDLGIASDESHVLTGDQLVGMSDDDLYRMTPHVDVYARAAPQDKLRIVQSLQSHDQVVAVTGDGVNDAPALRAADIGVAMGKSGTDIAREASDMVLTDDNFVSISAAVEEGRVAFENLRKVTFFLISTGAAVILTILTTLVLDWPLPYVAAQILWLNLVTNGLQDVALAFEPGEKGLMRHKPRPVREGILSSLLWERTVIAGLVMATGTLYLFDWALGEYGSLGQAQSIALTTMVLFQAFQVGNARSSVRSVFRISPFSNPFLFVATALALAVHTAALYFPPTQFVLRVEPIPLEAWTRIVLVAATIIVAMEIHKLLRRPAEQV
jgi:calcium-translocating P-type ATPase